MPVVDPLPKRDGHVITSAEFGQTLLVEVTYNTNTENVIADDDDDSNVTLHGPFYDMDEAQLWMDDYPDSTDVRDMRTIYLNEVR